MSPMLARAVRYITSLQDHTGSHFRVFDKQMRKRVTMIQSISAIVYLSKLKKNTSSQEKLKKLRSMMRNTGSLILLSTLYPSLHKLLGKQLPHKRFVIWCLSIISSLMMATKVPNWLVSYVTVESLSDRILSFGCIGQPISHIAESTLVLARQAILCAIIPILYVKSNKPSIVSGAGKVLFTRRSFLRDFVIFYSVWNFLSLYNYGKRLLFKGRNNKDEISIRNVFHYPDEWPIRSSNMKPLMDKLTEIHEIAFQNSRPLFDKFMNSPLVENVIPCIKWAVWRQVCYKSLTHVPHHNHNSAVNSKLMQSITMMLTFYILDGREYKMNVRPGVLRYLTRCILNRYLTNWNKGALKVQLFIMSQLTLLNETSSEISS